MATQEELNREKQLNEEKKKGVEINEKNNSTQDKARAVLADLVNNQRTLNSELRDQLGIRQSTDDFGKALLKLSRDITKATEQNSVALGRSGALSKQILQDDVNLEAAKRELAISMIGVKGDEIAQAQKLKDLNSTINDSFKELETLEESLLDLNEKELKIALARKEEILNENAVLENKRDTILETATKEVERIALAEQLVDNAQKQTELRNEELETQTQINAAMGVTGAVTKSAKLLTEGLGLGSLANLFNIEAANKEIETEIDLLIRAAESRGESVKKTDILIAKSAAVGKMLGGAVKTAFSFESILGAIVGEYLKFNKAQVDGQRLTGQSMKAIEGFNTSIASTKDVLELSNSLTKELGMNANNIFKPKVLQGAAEMQKLLGLSAHEAGKLAILSQKTGKPVKEVAENIVNQVGAFNKANKQAISQGVIMRDIGEASKSITLSLGSNPTLIADAASEARRLGVSLNELDKIAGSLLNFESSIEAELEAQLLTGNRMNLSKARELALNNDLAGVGRELFKNAGDVAKFGNMNRIQQEAQAKALGLSRDQMAKIAYQQGIANKMTKEQAAAAAGVELADMERIAATENFQQAISKLAGAFAPLINVVADIMSTKLAPYFLIAAGAVYALGGSFKGAIGGMTSFFGGLKENLNPKNFNFKNIKEKITGLFSGDSAGKITKDAQGRFRDAKGRFAKNPMSKTMDKGAEATGKMQKKTKGASGGKGVKSFLTGLGDGLASIGQKFGKVIQGALALGIAGIAIGGSFALALKMVKNVDPVQMIAFAGSIALFGGALALLGNMASQIIQGAVAMGILSLAAIGFATAFSMLEGVDTNKMIAFSIAVPLLGLAAAGLGFLAPFIMAGSLAIGALGLSLIPLAGAFALLGAVNVEGILGQLGSFATMAPGLLIAGAGLLGLSAGLIAFSAAMTGASILGGLTSLFGGGVMGDLQALTAMAGPLAQVGVSLTAIAAGISGIALALSQLETAKIDELKGLVMSTAIAAPMVAASGAITDLIAGITGGGSQDSSNKELLAEIKLLRAAVESGGDVFIDGNKAGNLISMAAYKTA